MIKILVADDQELIRQSLMIVLNDIPDFRVIRCASDGMEVLEALEEEMPDIILMDIRMPRMDGLLCAKKVKELYPNIKVIILTTFDIEEYVFYAMKFRVDGYLLKGISMKDLSAAIRKVYNGSVVLNDSITPKVVRMFSQLAQINLTFQIDQEVGVKLKPHEWDVIRLVSGGFSNREISVQLHLSEGTVRNTLSTVLSKLRLRDRTQLAIWAMRVGAGNVLDNNNLTKT